jgi:hypothetical protein
VTEAEARARLAESQRLGITVGFVMLGLAGCWVVCALCLRYYSKTKISKVHSHEAKNPADQDLEDSTGVSLCQKCSDASTCRAWCGCVFAIIGLMFLIVGRSTDVEGYWDGCPTT